MTPRACLAALFGAGLCLMASAASATGPSLNITPRPQLVQLSTSAPVRLAEGAAIVTPRGDASAAATARWLADLSLRSRGLRLVPRAGARRSAILLARVAGSADDEGYVLDVGHGRAVIRASSDAGLMYGAVTLWQMISAEDGRGPVRLPSVHIADHPRFVWRGLLLDSARHMQSAAFIERLIDWMALHKLNVLQWHLTDDQGWRLPIDGYPLLTSIGAWRVPATVGPPPRDPRTGQPVLYGGYYSRAQIRRIVAHAKARNVTVVPEIEMPGHAVAAFLAYPELSASQAPLRSIQSDWGIFPYAYGVDDHVFAFLDHVLDQVTELFPSRYIHIGGDEMPLDIWKASPKVEARMRALGIADEVALQNYFISRIDGFLTAHGRRLVGWEEILKGAPLPPGAVITSWQGARSALAAAEAGHDTIIAIDPTLYFDHRQSGLASEPPGRGQVISLQDVYALDPASPPLPSSAPATTSPPGPPPAFTDADRAHILGVQGNLWSEHVRTEERAAAMIFPRATAVAEAGWSAQADRQWPDFLARMPAEFARFARLGLDEDRSVFAVDVQAAPAGGGRARVTLASQTGYGQIRYTLDGRAPQVTSAAYDTPLDIAIPAQIQAASFQGARRISPIVVKELDALSMRRRASQELTLCPGGLALNLEAPPDRDGQRPVMLVQVMNACWIWPDAALDGVEAVKVTVGALPFNFQLGQDLAKIVRRPAVTPGGELQVRLDSCTGELLASEPLGPAKPGLTTFTAALAPRTGTHALCFAFTGASPDPIWAVDAVQLVPKA